MLVVRVPMDGFKVNCCSSSSSGIDPSPSTCPICLNFVKEEAFLDRCFHKFCYDCVCKWADVVSQKARSSRSFLECPICKQENSSIIHSWTGDFFQRHYVGRDPGFYLTESHKYRLKCYATKPCSMYQKFSFQKYWKLYKYLHKNKWLYIWLKREIQALTQEEDADVLVHHILGIMTVFARRNKGNHPEVSPEKEQQEFRALVADAVRPFLSRATERFVDELELFLVCGLNIEAYDNVYSQCLGSNDSEMANEQIEADMHVSHFINFDMFHDDGGSPS